MSTENKVDYSLIEKRLGKEGVILAKVLINDMISSHQDGYVGAYIIDCHYHEVMIEMGLLISHLLKYEGAVLEADHLVSLKNIDKDTFEKEELENPENLPF
ncbi:hypothetical protein [Pedobacter antarcticus]|uniref:hypothetical protein n=1 Tax=Pedobacter antarcticus TaxID=34086 RepID=UPI00292F226F|nr:hypothetical protein [Pedobacter antarcticus]